MTDRSYQIIDHLKTVTLLNLPDTGSNVFIGDTTFVDESRAPALCLMLGSNEVLGDNGQQTTGFIDRFLEVRLSVALFDNSQARYLKMTDINASVYNAMQSGKVALLTALPWVADYWLSGDSEPNISTEHTKNLYTQEVFWVFHYRHSIESTES